MFIITRNDVNFSFWTMLFHAKCNFDFNASWRVCEKFIPAAVAASLSHAGIESVFFTAILLSTCLYWIVSTQIRVENSPSSNFIEIFGACHRENSVNFPSMLITNPHIPNGSQISPSTTYNLPVPAFYPQTLFWRRQHQSENQDPSLQTSHHQRYSQYLLHSGACHREKSVNNCSQCIQNKYRNYAVSLFIYRRFFILFTLLSSLNSTIPALKTYRKYNYWLEQKHR